MSPRLRRALRTRYALPPGVWACPKPAYIFGFYGVSRG